MSLMHSVAPTALGGGRKLKNDLILILSLLLLLSALGGAFLLLRPTGDLVTVSVDGVTTASYSLLEDQTVDIRTGEQQEHVNRLVIRDHTAYVERADCPDGICAAHRPISRNGESIICLPHRVVITVRTASDTATPDIIT